MRTDVKIGVATGLILVLALVVWQLVFVGNEPSSNADSTGGDGVAMAPSESGDGKPAPSNGDRGLPRFGVMPGEAPSSPGTTTPENPVIPSIRETPVTPVVTPNHETPEPPVTPVIPSIRETPITPVTPVTPSIRETPITPVTPVTPSIRETPITPVTPVIPSIRETPITPVTPVIPSIRETPITPVEPPVAGGAGQTYVVQKGDSGFWAIASKFYGDGRHWTLIAQANPGMDSNALRPGSKLTIPPKPVTRPAAPGSADGTTPGGIVVSPSGQRHYVVKKGDSGFWAISKTVYGDGKYWALIAKANPSANSNRLQPGDVLAIPDRAPQAAVGSGGSTALAPAVSPGPGEKLYTVTKQDSEGFWGIAKRHYGNGVYWTLIAKANPKVSSDSLKAGQQLVIPELTEAAVRARAGASARTRTESRPAARRTDIEDIGPTPKFN